MVKQVGFLLFGIAILINGCSPPPSLPTPTLPAAPTNLTVTVHAACTLVGCSDTLSVSLQGQLLRDFTVEVVSEEVGVRQVRRVHCIDGVKQDESGASRVDDSDCFPSAVVFTDLAPAQATVTVEWEGGRVSDTVQPKYQVERPNGPNCPGECRVGGVVLTLPVTVIISPTGSLPVFTPLPTATE